MVGLEGINARQARRTWEVPGSQAKLEVPDASLAASGRLVFVLLKLGKHGSQLLSSECDAWR